MEDDVGEGSFYKKVEEGSYLLFGGRKVVKWSPGVIWKAELLSDDLGYLAKEISKVLKVRPDFFFKLLIIKHEMRKINLGENY